ncbi:hypothetical protein [Vibrio jasicida]|uniref:hypothetical protein n=1 Tax=Vibrio jasicida TaxID=766224 RepID=UPI0006ACDDE6|nr:hypothetical protein [Vibrio jasicida]
MNKFNLVENASDSLKHALRHMGPLEEHGLGNWKRIISDLSHVVELLFKERLRRIHPAFLFTNIDKYPSHNIHTVNADLACKRLQKIGGIEFSEEDLKAIQVAREKRNEIEHYEFAISDHEAKALVGQVTLFIFNFLKNIWDSIGKKNIYRVTKSCSCTNTQSFMQNTYKQH